MTAEAWRPGILEREMRRAGGLPAVAQVAALGAWFAWWGSRLIARPDARDAAPGRLAPELDPASRAIWS